ncbi:MAG: MFS transporter [Bacteroidia bacterium]|nr:MFS transporter [Bacteroidia bacterium]
MSTTLTQKNYLGYGLGDFGQNILFQSSIIYLGKFYTDIIGIDPAWIAGLFLLARLWDGINDPIMGFLAQRTHSKWGSYRPYLLWAAFPLALSMFLLFYVPEFLEDYKYAYVAISYLFFGMAFTAYNVPYGTLTAVMSPDYHERGKLTGYRMSFAMLGGIIGATLILPTVKAFGGGREAYAWTGALFGGIILLTSLGSFFSVKETERISFQKGLGFGKGLAVLRKNYPFWLLSICFAACFAAYAVFATSVPYYCQYVLGNEDLASWILLALTGITALGIPFWSWLSPKLGKRMIFLIGAIAYILAYIGLYYLPSLPQNLIYPLMVVHGIGNAAAVYTSWAILPDTIEYGQWKGGDRVEGLSYGIYGFCFKAGLGLGGALALSMLDSSGYIPGAEQTAAVKNSLSQLVSLIPMVLILLAAIALWFYPIDAEMHKKIREEVL